MTVAIEREERMDSLEEGVERLRKVISCEILPFLERNPHVTFLAPPIHSVNNLPPTQDIIQRHIFLEIGIVLEGTMGMWWGGRMDVCPKGTVLLTPPRCPHLPHVPLPDRPAHRVLWLIFPPHQCIAHQCAWREGVHFVGTYCVLDDNEIIYLGRAIWREYRQQDPHSPIVLWGYLIALFGRMLRAPARPAVPKYERLKVLPNADDPLVESVYQFLWSNYNRPINLTDLATAIAYSPTYLCRRFRQRTGESPFQTLRRIRIEVAKRLLALNLPVSTVAEMVGFSDPLYFSKVFSQLVKMAPTSYRERHMQRHRR